MTVIAFRNGVMAADRMAVRNGTFANQVTKITRRESDGALIGMAGSGPHATLYARWLIDGEPGAPPSLGDAEDNGGIFIAYTDGRVEERTRHGAEFPEGEFFAWGCGADHALAAMEMGADAKRAVEVACKYDIHCGGGIDVLYLDASRVVSLRE